jgi:DNA-binding MarR family transcriptional regulator
MNTMKDNPRRGLSKLQREILTWIDIEHERYGDFPWVFAIHRPYNLRKPGFYRAIEALEKRGLIEKDNDRADCRYFHVRPLPVSYKLVQNSIIVSQHTVFPHIDAPISQPKEGSPQ